FLISLSSSGKRYDSVSRESSVHSMMSMNCFFRKSMIAMAPPGEGQRAQTFPPRTREGKSYLTAGNCETPSDVSSATPLGLRGGPELLELGLGVRHLGLDHLDRKRAGNHGAVGEHERRRRADLERIAERLGLGHRVAAVTLVVGHRARGEE